MGSKGKAEREHDRRVVKRVDRLHPRLLDVGVDIARRKRRRAEDVGCAERPIDIIARRRGQRERAVRIADAGVDRHRGTRDARRDAQIIICLLYTF